MIGVFSGTSDGRSIVEGLLNKGHQVVCFNATAYGGTLYADHVNLTVYDYKMDYQELIEKVELHRIEYIIDSTHPFAEIISRNLINLSEERHLKYMRYERPSSFEGAYNSYDQMICDLKKTQGPILLTIGSNNLAYFTKSDLIKRLFVRVLPTLDVIEKCIQLGLSPKQIIGMQGPFSHEFNLALMKMLDIKHMVTKASGQAGGLKEKISAANELDIHTYVLKRPSIDYKKTYKNIRELLKEF